MQRGFSLVSAIFLLVVLAGLGAVMVTFSTAQHQGLAMDVLGSRAYQAANAGVEWAAYGVAQTPQTVPATKWAGCDTIPNPLFAAGTLAGTLSPFKVAVTCTSNPYTEGSVGPTIYVYDITSTATGVNGAEPGSADYMERVINVKMGR